MKTRVGLKYFVTDWRLLLDAAGDNLLDFQAKIYLLLAIFVKYFSTGYF